MQKISKKKGLKKTICYRHKFTKKKRVLLDLFIASIVVEVGIWEHTGLASLLVHLCYWGPRRAHLCHL